MGLLNLVDYIQRYNEREAYRKELQAPGTDIYDPAEQQKLLAMTPMTGLGTNLITQAPEMYKLQQQRAIAKNMLVLQAGDEALKAHNGALTPAVSAPAAPLAEGEAMGPDYGTAAAKAATRGLDFGNFAKADAAGKDVWDQYMDVARQNFGDNFANEVRARMPGGWSLDAWSSHQPVLNRILDAHRQDYLVVNPDGTKGMTPLLPGVETAEWQRNHPGSYLRPMAAGSDLPGRYVPATAQQAAGVGAVSGQVDTLSGRVEPIQTIQDAREKYLGAGGGNDFGNAWLAYKNIKDGLAQANAVGDLKAIAYQVQLERGGKAPDQGTVISLGQQNLLPPLAQKAWNALADNTENPGQFSRDARLEISRSTDQTMDLLRRKHAGSRRLYEDMERQGGIEPGVLTGGIPWPGDEEFARLKAPARQMGAPEGAPGGPGGADEPVTIRAQREALIKGNDFESLDAVGLKQWKQRYWARATREQKEKWTRYAVMKGAPPGTAGQMEAGRGAPGAPGAPAGG